MRTKRLILLLIILGSISYILFKFVRRITFKKKCVKFAQKINVLWFNKDLTVLENITEPEEEDDVFFGCFE